MPGVHVTVYLWQRLFKFICGCQMSEIVRASVYCQGCLFPKHLQTIECVRIMFPILVLSDTCVYVLFLGLQLTVVDYVDPRTSPACMSMCVCAVLCVCLCVCMYSKIK